MIARKSGEIIRFFERQIASLEHKEITFKYVDEGEYEVGEKMEYLSERKPSNKALDSDKRPIGDRNRELYLKKEERTFGISFNPYETNPNQILKHINYAEGYVLENLYCYTAQGTHKFIFGRARLGDNMNDFVMINRDTAIKRIEPITPASAPFIQDDVLNIFPDSTQQYAFVCTNSEIQKYHIETGARESMTKKIPEEISSENGHPMIFEFDQFKEECYIADSSGFVHKLIMNDPRTDKPKPVFDNHGHTVVKIFSLTKLVAANSDSHQIKIISRETLETIETKDISNKVKTSCLAVSRRHQMIFCGTESGSIEVVMTEEVKSIERKGLKLPIKILLVTRDENELVAFADGKLLTWTLPDLTFSQEIDLECKVHQVWDLSNDFIAVKTDMTPIEIWNCNDYTPILTIREYALDAKNKDVARFKHFTFLSNKKRLLEVLTNGQTRTFVQKQIANYNNTREIPFLDGGASESNFIKSKNVLDIAEGMPEPQDKGANLARSKSGKLQYKDVNQLTPEESQIQLSWENRELESAPNSMSVKRITTLKSHVVGQSMLLGEAEIKDNILFVVIDEDPLRLWLITQSNYFYCYSLPALKPIRKTFFKSKHEVSQICFDQKRRLIYFGDHGGQLHIFNLRKNAISYKFGFHFSSIKNIEVSRMHKMIFTSCEENEFKIWNMETLKIIRCFSIKNNIEAILLNDNARMIGLSYNKFDKHIDELWNIETFEPITGEKFHSQSNLFRFEIQKQPEINSFNFVRVFNKVPVKSDLMAYRLLQEWELSEMEKFYIEKCFLGGMSDDLILWFRRLHKVYESSFVLQRYFNIYLAAVFRRNNHAFLALLLQEQVTCFFDVEQMSPLEFLVEMKEIELLKTILSLIQKKRLNLTITPKIFDYMHEFDALFIDRFLISNIRIVKRYDNPPRRVKKIGPFDQTCIVKQQFREYLVETYEQSRLPKVQKGGREIEIYGLNLHWDFGYCAPSSLLFLKWFSESDNDEFLLSPYAHIVKFKWKKWRFAFAFQTLVMFALVACYLSYFMRGDEPLFIVSVSCLAWMTLYEIWKMAAVGWEYLKNIWHIFDLLNYALCYILMLMKKHGQIESYGLDNAFKYFLFGSIMAVSIRGFSYFKYLPYITHVPRMTLSMLRDSSGILVLLVYFLVVISIIHSQMSDKFDMAGAFYLQYNILFGNVPNITDVSETTPFQNALSFVSSILLPIFLINFLIAKLTSVYEECDAKHKVIEQQELAGSIREIEIMFSLVGRLFGHEVVDKKGHMYLTVDKQVVNDLSSTEEEIQQFRKIGRRIKTESTKIQNKIVKVMSSVEADYQMKHDIQIKKINELKEIINPSSRKSQQGGR